MAVFKIDGLKTSPDGLKDLTLTYEKNDNGVRGFSTSTTLSFTGDGYDYLYDKFFADRSTGCEAVVAVTYKPDCCNFTYELEINNENIKLCKGSDCRIEANLQTPDNKYECLFDRLFFANDNGGLSGSFQQAVENGVYKGVRFCYCNEMNLISIVVALIVTWIAFIVDMVAFLCKLSVIGLATGLCNEISDWADNIREAGSGCRKYHTGFYVKDALAFNADACGLQFQSSFFNDPTYANMALISAIYDEGESMNDTTIWRDENAYNANALQLFQEIGTLIGKETRIRGNEIYLESKQFYIDSAPLLFDASADTYCLEYGEDNYAYANLKYAVDSQDVQGNKMLPFYNAREDWKDNDCQKGGYEVTNVFGATRFMNDCQSPDFIWDNILDDLRENLTGDNWRPIIGNGQAERPKIVLINSSTKDDFCQQVQRRNSTTCFEDNGVTIKGGTYDYNYDMWYEERLKNGHAENDPRLSTYKPFVVSGIEKKLTCDQLEVLINNGIDVAIEIDGVRGQPEAITLDPNTNIIQVNGLRI